MHTAPRVRTKSTVLQTVTQTNAHTLTTASNTQYPDHWLRNHLLESSGDPRYVPAG